jgi:hypothetical protein
MGRHVDVVGQSVLADPHGREELLEEDLSWMYRCEPLGATRSWSPTSPRTADEVYGVAIAPDGKIVAAGLAGDGGRAPLIGVVRYLVRIAGRAQPSFPRPSVDHRE